MIRVVEHEPQAVAPAEVAAVAVDHLDASVVERRIEVEVLLLSGGRVPGAGKACQSACLLPDILFRVAVIDPECEELLHLARVVFVRIVLPTSVR